MRYAFLTLVLILISSNGFADSTEGILSGYHDMQTALGNDELKNSVAAAKAMDAPTQKWLKNNTKKNKKYENVLLIEKGINNTEKAKDLKAARAGFGEISEGVVEFIRLDSDLQKKWQLFYCPMAPKYRYWVQPKGETILNPYMGQSMPKCGGKRKW